MLYLFIKWLHIIAIISWMAGILYLYRLFIYHVEYGATNPEIAKLLKLMERRLYRYITFPAMIVAWFAGLSMVALNPFFLTQTWFMIKLFCILCLSYSTIYANHIHKQLDLNPKSSFSSKQLRILNEVPTLLMMIIVAMVIFRPFVR